MYPQRRPEISNLARSVLYMSLQSLLLVLGHPCLCPDRVTLRFLGLLLFASPDPIRRSAQARHKRQTRARHSDDLIWGWSASVSAVAGRPMRGSKVQNSLVGVEDTAWAVGVCVGNVFMYACTYLFMCGWVCGSDCLSASVCACVCLSVGRSVGRSVCACLSVCLSSSCACVRACVRACVGGWVGGWVGGCVCVCVCVCVRVRGWVAWQFDRNAVLSFCRLQTLWRPMLVVWKRCRRVSGASRFPIDPHNSGFVS